MYLAIYVAVVGASTLLLGHQTPQNNTPYLSNRILQHVMEKIDFLYNFFQVVLVKVREDIWL